MEFNFNLDDFDELEEKVEQPAKPKVEIVDEKPKPQPTQQAVQQPKKQEGAVQLKKDSNYLLVENVLSKVVQQNGLTEESFTSKDKTIASDIIIMTSKAVKTGGYEWKDIDLISNNYVGDIKRWAKLGIDSHDYLYLDIRRNKNTGMVDLKIKPQYQTVEKLIMKYCKKDIFNFKTDVICVGDTFESTFDFATGQDRVIKHIKAENRDPNNLDNITGAYKIAYAREKNGDITQILTIIDKNRIMRAYNAAQTKNVWNADTFKMVKKTVTWEMWNSEAIRPFMEFPYELTEDLEVVNESSDVDFSNKDHQYKNVDSASESAKSKVGSGDVIDVEL